MVSGRRTGLCAAASRVVLRAAETPYTWAVRWRNRRYDRGSAVVHRVGVPVISVGNLTLGGTGKTPMVEWLARWFRRRGVAVGVVSRGYGGGRDVPNDEAMELAWKLPDVPHVQNPDRVAAARKAIDKFHAGLILLDDAFQHRRIGRDLDLVLLDALEPFGYEHVFPRGTLREPPAGLARADVVALSRADMVSPERREAIRRRVEVLAPRAVWLELAHVPLGLLSFGRTERPLASLAGQRVLAFCGIGNPAGFRHTLDACGFQVAELLEFPDHHAYDRRDLDVLAAAAQRHEATAVVCTQKDLVKVGLDRLGDRPLWAIRIGLEILCGQESFEARLVAVR